MIREELHLPDCHIVRQAGDQVLWVESSAPTCHLCLKRDQCRPEPVGPQWAGFDDPPRAPYCSTVGDYPIETGRSSP
jgi:hypothetical protein